MSDNDDPDWLLTNYVNNNVAQQQPLENVLVQESQDEEGDDKSNNNVDFEDLEELFFITSAEEDRILDRFVSWMSSVDGGFTPLRTAKQNKCIGWNFEASRCGKT